MRIETPFDYADARRSARSLCSRIAFGDEDPKPLAAAAHDALASASRHRRTIQSRQHARTL